MCVGMRDALGVLENIGHLLQEYAILSFDLSVPLFKHLVLFRFRPQMRVLLRPLYLDGRLDVLQLSEMNLMFFFLPFGGEQLACFRLSSVHDT